MRKQVLVVLLSLVTTVGYSQLVAGDIAFIGINEDSPVDGFSIVTLAPIPGSTAIYFTDQGISSSTTWVGNSEDHWRFTAPASGIACGTIISFTENVANELTITGVSGATIVHISGTGLFNLSGGDQMIAYTVAVPGVPASPADATFIAAITADDGNGSPTCLDVITGWSSSGGCVGTNVNRSIIPPGLTNGVNCISIYPSLGTELDNSKYNGTLTGTSAQIRTSVNDRTNWIGDDASNYVITPSGYPTPSITCGVSCPLGSTWLGNVSTDWNNASNWCGGVPTASTDVTINTGSSNYPIVSTTANVRNLTLNSTTSLTITGMLNIAGSLVNTGTLTATNGTIIFNGSSTQTIPVAAFSTNTIKNLTINNTAGVTLLGTLNVNDMLTIADGTLTTSGLLTLISDATNTGRVGNSAGSIIGNVTVQRFIPSGRRAFRFLAHPFTTNLPMSALTDNIDITGTGGLPFTATTTNAPSAFWYNNVNGNITITPTDPGWTALTASSTLNAKTGYRVLVRGTKGQANSLTGGSYTPAAVTLDWAGTLNQGQQVVTLSRANANAQYNLIGNPYASPVDLSLTTRGVNINANFSVWNPNASTRGAYVTQAFSTPYILPSGAAFFAQTTNNSSGNTITFEEADKSTSSPNALFRTNNAEGPLIVELLDANNSYADQLTFYFDNTNRNYTVNNDALWDAEKLSNPDANLYSLSADGKRLAVDRRPLADNAIIPLGLTHTSNNANFTLTVKELPTINNHYNLYLKDKWLNTTTLLQANTTINIAITSNTESQGNNRFEIVTKLKPLLAAAASTFTVSLTPNPTNGKTVLSYTQPTAENTTIIITNIIGKKVQTIHLGKVQNGVQTLNIAKLVAGIYYVQVNNGVETKIEELIVQ